MKKKQDVVSHHYNELSDNVRCTEGNAPLTLDPHLPFTLTRFEYMNNVAQADYSHRHN